MISPSLIATIGVFRMLQVPQGAAARNRRNGGKVISWRRRTDGPFQCPCIPGIVTGPGSLDIRNYEVCQEHENCECLNKRTDSDDEVQGVPTATGLICVDPPWHPENAGNVHHVERHVKANQEQPKMQFAEAFAQHSAGHFGIPVIKCCKKCE